MSERWILLWGSVTLSLGILCYERLPLWGLGIAACLVFVISYFLLMGQTQSGRKRVLFSLGLLLFCLAGAMRMNLADTQWDEASSWVLRGEGLYQGVVKEPPLVMEDGDYTRYFIELEGIQYPDGEEKPLTGTAYLYTAKEQVLHCLGERIQVQGTMSPLRNYKNPGKIDLDGRYRSRRLLGRLYPSEGEEVHSLGDSDFYPVERLAEGMKDRLVSSFVPYMDEKRLHILMTLLFGGQYNEIPAAVMNSFSATGIVHILSVSGSHVALLFSFLYFIGKWAGLPNRMIILFSISLVLFYGLLAGMVPPVIRAVVMGILAVGGVFLEREKETLNLLGAAVLGMLLWDPFYLYDVSFQLSVGASAGILIFYSPLLAWEKKKFPAWPWIQEGIALAIAAQLLTIPIILYDFHVFPLFFIPANLLVAPLLEWVIIAGLLAAVASWLYLPLAGGILQAADYLLWAGLRLNFLLSSLPKASVGIGGLTGWQNGWYYLTVGALYFRKELRRVRWKGLLTLSFWCVLSLWLCVLYWQLPKTRVYCPDLGPDQGMVLVKEDKKIVYYKGGGVTSHRSAWEWNSFLGYEGIFAADILILNLEEVKGTLPLTLSLPVKEIWVTGGSWEKKAPQLMKQYTAPVRVLQEGKLVVGDVRTTTNGSSWLISSDEWDIYLSGKRPLPLRSQSPHRLWLVGQGGYRELTEKEIQIVKPEVVIYTGNRLNRSFEDMELFDFQGIPSASPYRDGMQTAMWEGRWKLVSSI